MTEQQEAFRKLVQDCVQQFGSPDALAKKMGIAPQSIYRVLKDQFTMSLGNCLRLSEVSGIDTSSVLRLAGKGKTAELLERLYGKSELDPGERALLADWRRVPVGLRPNLRGIVRDMADAVHPQSHPETAVSSSTPPATRGIAPRKSGRSGR